MIFKKNNYWNFLKIAWGEKLYKSKLYELKNYMSRNYMNWNYMKCNYMSRNHMKCYWVGYLIWRPSMSYKAILYFMINLCLHNVSI